MACHFCIDNPESLTCPNCGCSGGERYPNSFNYGTLRIQKEEIRNENSFVTPEFIIKQVQKLIEHGSLKNTNFKSEFLTYVNNIRGDEKIKDAIININSIINRNWLNKPSFKNRTPCLVTNKSHILFNKKELLLVEEYVTLHDFLEKRQNLSDINNSIIENLDQIGTVGNILIKIKNSKSEMYKIFYNEDSFFINQVHIPDKLFFQAMEDVIHFFLTAKTNAETLDRQTAAVGDILTHYQISTACFASSDRIRDLKDAINKFCLSSPKLDPFLGMAEDMIINKIHELI